MDFGPASLRLVPAQLTLAASITVAVAFAAAGTAQGPIDTGDPIRIDDIDDTVEVRVINVDVTVLDKKSRPVSDLRREDFRLFEDGKEVAIDYFTAATRPSARRAQAAQPPTGETAGEANRPAVAAPHAVPLTVAIYLDDRATHAMHRRRVLQDLAAFLEQSGDLPAEWILARFRNRLEVVAGPTRIIEDISAALPSIDEPDPRGMQWRQDERRALRGIQQVYELCAGNPRCETCIDNWGQMLDLARSHAANESNRMALVTRGLADLVGSLSGVEGRKNVLYVGDGFELRGGLATLGYLADLCEHVRPDTQSEIFRVAVEQDNVTRLEELTAYANSNRVSLFMLDAQGVHAGRRHDVETGALNIAGDAGQLAPTIQNDRLRMDNFQATHSALALQTGGRAILNQNRPLGALGDVATSWTNATYSLGFTPKHPASGEMHRLKVELVGRAAKGNRLSFRRSYRDKKAEAQLVDSLVSALYLDRTRNPLGVGVAAGVPERIVRDVYDVPIEIALPRTAFGAFPGSDDPRGQARVWLTAVHEAGARSDVRQQVVDIEPAAHFGDDPTHARQRMVVRIELIEGSSRVAVGVRDEVSRTTSLLTLPIEIVDD